MINGVKVDFSANLFYSIKFSLLDIKILTFNSLLFELLGDDTLPNTEYSFMEL
jgi:hypothetical protein